MQELRSQLAVCMCTHNPVIREVNTKPGIQGGGNPWKPPPPPPLCKVCATAGAYVHVY